MIHPTAIVHPNAKLGADVKIGPFCIVGENVALGNRVELVSNVIIGGKTSIGDDTIVYPFAVIGVMSQDLKWQDENAMTGVTIGKRNRIREYVTISSGTPASSGTTIGDDCQIMINAHVAHDCHLGNGIVLSNLVQIAGHVEIEDNVTVSACSAVHQFVHIGRNAFIGAMTGIGTDVLPYAIYDGNRAGGVYRTINKVGLLRHGFTNEDLHAVHKVYSAFFDGADGDNSAERLKKVRREVSHNKYAMDAIDFIENRSERGVSSKH